MKFKKILLILNGLKHKGFIQPFLATKGKERAGFTPPFLTTKGRERAGFIPPFLQLNGQKRAGFTLVELMVSVLIFTIMTAMVLVIISSASTTYHSADARIITQQDMRKALAVMIHEIAEGNQYRCYIPAADPTQIIFQIPIRVFDGGPLDGQTVDERNNIIFGARSMPTTNPDGYQDYAIQYLLQPNNDLSNSSSLIRRVLDSYPGGNQVGNDIVISNWINSINFTKAGKTLSVNVSTIKNNKFGRDVQVNGNFGITLRN